MAILFTCRDFARNLLTGRKISFIFWFWCLTWCLRWRLGRLQSLLHFRILYFFFCDSKLMVWCQRILKKVTFTLKVSSNTIDLETFWKITAAVIDYLYPLFHLSKFCIAWRRFPLSWYQQGFKQFPATKIFFVQHYPP